MSTLEDLELNAAREDMLNRCDALHEYPNTPDPECPGCQEKAQIALEDAENDRSVRA